MRTSKKMIALICIFALMVTSIPYVGARDASVEKNDSPFAEGYDELADDTIVCYMRGQPVYKYEVDEYGIVHKDFGDEGLNDESGIMLTASGSGGTIPTAHRGESITSGCNLVTTGFSQSEALAYLTVADAKVVASGFENGSSAATIVAGLSKKTGTYMGKITYVLGNIISHTLTGISKEITSLTSSGKKVLLEYVSSSYGTFCNVSAWNGTTCVKSGYSQNGVTVTVSDAICATHDKNIWG